MGEGLKRASVAAVRSRWDGTLTPEMRRFLSQLAPFTEPQTRGKIGCVVDRAGARARQTCRRLGLASYDRRADGKEGWQITPAGRQALAPSPTPEMGCLVPKWSDSTTGG